MANSNGQITAPVNQYDVQRVLGINVGGDWGRMCVSPSINKWARYKPVQYPGFPIRGQSGDQTFENKTGLSVGTMIDSPSQVAGWDDIEITYERPTGGTNSPYRITDFVRYNHYAQKPCEIIWRSVFKKDTGFGCTISIYDRSSDEETEYISFSDIMNEISGYSSFKNADKRLCMAVYDYMTSDVDPIWYFFSDKFSTVGSSGTWSVSANMSNTAFTNLLTVGRTYQFMVMLVSNHPYLEQIPGTGDRERWEYGVSPSEMANMETGQNPIEAMCLAFENGMDRTTATLQQASVITDMTYYLDVLSVEKWGNLVQSGNYHVLCTRLYMPTVTVKVPHNSILNSSAQYQMRVAYSGGQSGTMIFRPTDRSGNDYYEIESTPNSSLSELALTQWLRADAVYHSTELDPQGNTIDVYEFDFPNYIYTILSQTAEQTENENSGEFLFWDLVDNFTLSFYLYYKPSANASEVLVREIGVTYSVANNEGYVNDLEWTWT